MGAALVPEAGWAPGCSSPADDGVKAGVRRLEDQMLAARKLSKNVKSLPGGLQGSCLITRDVQIDTTAPKLHSFF